MSKPFAFPPEYLEKKFNEDLVGLDEFSYVLGFEEFRNFLINYRNNEKLITLSKLVDYNLYKPVDKSKDVEVIINAKKELNSFSIIVSKISLHAFIHVYSVIAYSCIGAMNRELTNLEINQIINSDLISKLSLGLDNFRSINDVILDRDFFKSFKKIKFNKESKKLDKTIYSGYFRHICVETLAESDLSHAFGMCANYLAGCYAFADGRVEVVPEDIIKGWTLTLNLFNMDLRPYVFR